MQHILIMFILNSPSPSPSSPLPSLCVPFQHILLPTSCTYLLFFLIPWVHLEMSAWPWDHPRQLVQPTRSQIMKKNDSPLPRSQQLPVVLLWRVGSHESLPSGCWNAALILSRPHAGNTCPEDSTSQNAIPHTSIFLWFFHSFCPSSPNVPWALWAGWSCRLI